MNCIEFASGKSWKAQRIPVVLEMLDAVQLLFRKNFAAQTGRRSDHEKEREEAW